jgi:hypothetical protein
MLFKLFERFEVLFKLSDPRLLARTPLNGSLNIVTKALPHREYRGPALPEMLTRLFGLPEIRVPHCWRGLAGRQPSCVNRILLGHIKGRVMELASANLVSCRPAVKASTKKKRKKKQVSIKNERHAAATNARSHRKRPLESAQVHANVPLARMRIRTTKSFLVFSLSSV